MKTTNGKRILLWACLVCGWLAWESGLHSAENGIPQKMVNDFNTDRQGWQIYDYNGGSGGDNVFYPQGFWF